MLYAFLGSTLLGALASALLLWRKSVAEKQLAQCQGQLKASQNEAEGWKTSYQTSIANASAREAQFNEKISRSDAELQTVKGQRDEALAKLVQSGAPGSVADLLRARANVPSGSASTATSKG